MPDIGGGKSPQRGPGAESRYGSGGRSRPEAVSFSVYSGPKIPCFATQSVL